MVSSITISNAENNLEKVVSRWNFYISALSFPRIIFLPKSFLIRLFLGKKLIKQLDSFYVILMGMKNVLEISIENISPDQAKELLKNHKNLKTGLIVVNASLSKNDFINNKELEEKCLLCIDISYDIEYIIRKRANVNKEKTPSELSQLLATKSKRNLAASL